MEIRYPDTSKEPATERSRRGRRSEVNMVELALEVMQGFLALFYLFLAL